MMREIQQNPQVNVSFSAPTKNSYLSATGVASAVTDKAKMEELWSPPLKAWFKEGLNTPGIVLLKIDLRDVEFWDAPSSPVVKAVGFVKAMVSDREFRPGRHERVSLRH